MKRYRVFGHEIDTRASFLSMEIKDSWEQNIQEQHRQDHQKMIEGLLAEYGMNSFEMKLRNFIDMGDKPYSILAFHNKFLKQIGDAFVSGAYYPALTGVGALGERILNHLVLRLRDSYRNTPQYKKVYSKESFADWNLAIDTLENWGVLLPQVVTKYHDLAELRHEAIHFNPEVDHNDRVLALAAIKLLFEIISGQFSAFGPQPWFITNIPGVCFIKKEWESKPFIRFVYLENCILVGAYHRLDYNPNKGFLVTDDYPYDERDLTDDEFSEMYKQVREAN